MPLKKNIPLCNEPLPVEALKYLSAIKKYMAKGTCVRHQTTLYRLYRWLRIKKLLARDFSPEHLIEHRRWCMTQGLQSSTCDVEFYNVRSYVVWLIRNGLLENGVTNFFQFSLKPADLPACAHLFLKHRAVSTRYAHRRYKQLLNLFHNWLLDQKIELAVLSKSDVILFLDFLGARGYTPKELHIRRLYMRIYFDWCRDRDITKVDFRDLFKSFSDQFRNFELPEFALQYLQEIQTTLREDTVKNYKTNFMGLHRFLHREGIDIRKLNREHCVSWMRFMFEKKKYSASTRLQRLVNTRGYLYWLVDNEILNANVDKLIKSTDFPVLDLTLPKPLPPKIDIEIQRRLALSENIYHKGAFLLRLTGMRLGELSRLKFDPIWRDDSAKTYIKVPIGKLHNERLVPIDEKTVKLIETIQCGSLPHLKRFSSEPEKGRLLLGPRGGSALHNVYRHFKIMSQDLESDGSIHPHRLRHTFATALMNAKLNPLIVMALLGHKDLRMTERYSLITNDTVYRDFFQAVDQSKFKIVFRLPEVVPLSNPFDPLVAIESVTKWLQRDEDADDRQRALIVKRLNRLRSEIQNLK